MFQTPGSPLRFSMNLGIARGAPTQGERMLGDIPIRARRLGLAAPLVDIASIHMRAYKTTDQ